MRFLFVLDSYNLGGAERQAYMLAISLLDRSHKVMFIALTTDGSLSVMLDKKNIEHSLLGIEHNFGKLNFPKISHKVKKAMNSYKPDVVLPYTFWPNVLCGLNWKKTTAKTCVWNQRDEIPFFNQSQELKALKKVSAIVANSKGGKSHVESIYPSQQGRIQIIHNGVRLANSTVEPGYWEKELEKESNVVSVVMIANLQRRKDHTALLDAWKVVIDHYKDQQIVPRLYLAGRFAGTQDALKARCFDMNFTKEVKFLGEVADVKGLLEMMDMAVFASFHEGCPNGVLEPMSLGLAVVANDIAGNKEALGDGNKGLFTSGDLAKFSLKLIELISNKTQRDAIGQINKQRIKDEFDVANLTDQYTKLCKSN